MTKAIAALDVILRGGEREERVVRTPISVIIPVTEEVLVRNFGWRSIMQIRPMGGQEN